MRSKIAEKEMNLVRRSAAELNETNDCVVRAMAYTTGKPYKVVHKVCADLGRRPRRGAYLHRIMVPGLAALGFKSRVVMDDPIQSNGYRYTATSIVRHPDLQSGCYVVEYPGHVGALVYGELMDWTRGKRNQVRRVWAIEVNR